jgi:hypothetical protein
MQLFWISLNFYIFLHRYEKQREGVGIKRVLWYGRRLLYRCSTYFEELPPGACHRATTVTTNAIAAAWGAVILRFHGVTSVVLRINL